MIGMNFYGTESRDEHTIAGRLIPLPEAFDLAIKKAANVPLPKKNHSAHLPVWAHNICDEFTKTIFKNVVGLAPQGKFDPRKCGRCVGLILRGAAFFFNEASAQMKREGLLDLSPVQEKKLEDMAGLNVVFQATSELWQKTVRNKDELVEAGQALLEASTQKLMGSIFQMLKRLAGGSVKEQHEFLCGIPEGFLALLDDQGDFALRRNRHEIHLLLLLHWPEIAEMQKAKPPKTRRDLLDWLAKREGTQLVGDLERFNGVCDDIGLALAPPGRPPKAGSE